MIQIPYDWVGNASVFDDISVFSNVIAISARGQWISKHVLERMARMPRLQELWLDQQPIGDDELQVFTDNRQLKVLGLFWTKISTASLATISSLQSLEELDLRDAQIDPTQVRQLCRNAYLTDLRLWGIPVTDEQIRELTCLRRLKELRLSGTSVSDKVANILIDFPNLEVIDLGDLSDSSVSTLLKLPKLKVIEGGDYCPKDHALKQEIRRRRIDIRCNDDLFERFPQLKSNGQP
jgi:hypothetical protein